MRHTCWPRKDGEGLPVGPQEDIESITTMVSDRDPIFRDFRNMGKPMQHFCPQMLLQHTVVLGVNQAEKVVVSQGDKIHVAEMDSRSGATGVDQPNT